MMMIQMLMLVPLLAMLLVLMPLAVQVLMLMLVLALLLKKIFAVDRNYNIAVVGDVGTAGAEYPIAFNTNLGRICFTCSDKDTIIDDGSLTGFHGAIIMIDFIPWTRINVRELIQNIRRDCPDIPIVLCGKKAASRHVQLVNDTLLAGNFMYCEICMSIERPFLLLAWMLVSHSIRITDMPHFVHPEVQRINKQDLFDFLYWVEERAFYISLSERMNWEFLKRNRNLDPNSSLPDHDDELMWMVQRDLERVHYHCPLPLPQYHYHYH